jgi:hypothetical protein
MRYFLGAVGLAGSLLVLSGPAYATGTARVQQRDGTVKVYNDVIIDIRNEEMTLTTGDGVGRLVIGKAACTTVGVLVKCLPYDATLYQNGLKARVTLRSGTVWLNPTTSSQPLSHTSTRLGPHGVLLSVTTTKGTYLSLTGTVDRVQK